ncbi:nucleotidyltransferase family protein [Szabonella alba]|uniref:Nucleotidyltransferase family protein n=1 Tax=Szabonella alba TaxID=2804194 RepID=A0A8K0V946_9RHOB|nr:nucleotidyltransferase family protein [Szabonella alba]MBL4916611.1 nucleotidyltransferase family protein [Szabonella alba]
MTPDALMIFAAGFGTRMGALTADMPKPLITVAGRALLDHALDLADAAGPGRIVVNTHYRGDQIAAHLADRPAIALSHEDVILETGGGLRKALPLLGAGPVFTLNSDAVWTGPNPLITLRGGWRAGMGALLLLAPPDALRGHSGQGDFRMDAQGRISRCPKGEAGLVYLGAQILDPAGLQDFDETAFSLNRLWDRMIVQGRAFGILHPGGWCDVGRPEGIAEAEAMLRGAGDVF